MIADGDEQAAVAAYAAAYRDYFLRNADGTQTCLDPAPRWAVAPGLGLVAFGADVRHAGIALDIARHTIRAVAWGEALGGWQPLGEAEIFAVEYWELEQAKLRNAGSTPVLAGKVALVSGAASGIGAACAAELRAQGATVVGLDVQPRIAAAADAGGCGLVCDVTDDVQVRRAVDAAVTSFGGLDIVVSNAGSFPSGAAIAAIGDDDWRRGMELNLDSHLKVLRAAAPFLELGVDPAVVVVASRNVPAPGRGAAIYSAAKAGLTQLARVAALELGAAGVRVNVVHPDAVFDTGIWTPQVLAQRAAAYGMSVDEYRRKNVLRTEVTAADVARMVAAMAGPIFAKTTGAQVPVDGGNDRVI